MLQTFFFPLKLWPPELACFLKGPNLFLALLVFFLFCHTMLVVGMQPHLIAFFATLGFPSGYQLLFTGECSTVYTHWTETREGGGDRLATSKKRGARFFSRPQVEKKKLHGCFLPKHIFLLYKNRSGKSPGFGLTLTAETTTGAALSAEVFSSSSSSDGGGDRVREPTVPEELGVRGAHALLEEVYRGGCVDSTVQSLQFLLMALSQQVGNIFFLSNRGFLQSSPRTYN